MLDQLLRSLRLRSALAFALVLGFALSAFAQDAAPAAQIVITDPTGGLLTNVPGGIYIWGLVSLTAGLVSVFVKDSSLPKWLGTILNLLGNNFGRAKNDPETNATAEK